MSGAQHSRRKPAHVATYYGFVRILCTIRTKKDTKKDTKSRKKRRGARGDVSKRCERARNDGRMSGLTRIRTQAAATTGGPHVHWHWAFTDDSPELTFTIVYLLAFVFERERERKRDYVSARAAETPICTS